MKLDALRGAIATQHAEDAEKARIDKTNLLIASLKGQMNQFAESVLPSKDKPGGKVKPKQVRSKKTKVLKNVVGTFTRDNAIKPSKATIKRLQISNFLNSPFAGLFGNTGK